MNESSVSTQEAQGMPVEQKRKPSMLLALLSAVWVFLALFNLYLVLISMVMAVQVFTASETATVMARHEALVDVQYHGIITFIVCLMLAGAHMVHKWGEKKHQ